MGLEAQSEGGVFRRGPPYSWQVRGGGGAAVEERPTGSSGPPQVVGNCRKLGAPKVFYIAADMASPEAPESVVQFALDKLGEGLGLKPGVRDLGLGLRDRTGIGLWVWLQ